MPAIEVLTKLYLTCYNKQTTILVVKALYNVPHVLDAAVSTSLRTIGKETWGAELIQGKEG